MEKIVTRQTKRTMVAIPDDVRKAAHLSETELRQEIALLLFQKGLPLMKAAAFAEMDRFAFQHLLASRKIPVHYGVEDFEHDVEALESK